MKFMYKVLSIFKVPNEFNLHILKNSMKNFIDFNDFRENLNFKRLKEQNRVYFILE